jgi:hypothetical protein
MEATVRSGSRVGTGAAGGALAALAAAVLIAAAPARAGQDPGIRVGVYSGGDAVDPVATVGVFGRLDIPGPVNLELSADYRKEKILDGGMEATVVPVRVSAVLNFLPVVSPYLLAGAGADFIRVDFGDNPAATGSESSVSLEVHAGGGVEVALGPVSLIADLRYCRVEPMASDAVHQALGHDYDPSGWHASLSAGVSF